jgi:hypothetical protein
MQARTLGVEAAATGQEAGVAARWPPLIVGLKIESVSRTRVFVQRTGQASLIQNKYINIIVILILYIYNKLYLNL